jgi:glucose-6-phosphate 1-epimerase
MDREIKMESIIDLGALNEQYGIPGRVVFKAGPGGLAFVEVINAHGRIEVTLQGGQVVNWVPRDGREVIWLSEHANFSEGKSIRGGIPVCWPWFGPHQRESSFPAHGFARTAPWRVVAVEETDAGITRLILQLEQNEGTRRFWADPCALSLQIGLGAALELELVTRNTGAAAMVVGEALHTYFRVGDVRKIAVYGLDGCAYLDKTDGMKRKRQAGPLRFGGETDRVYLDTVAACLIEDPVLNRRIRVSKHGSRSTVVWNPWREKAAKMGDLGGDGYLHMVCVESANAADNRVTIVAGEEHRLGVSYAVESLVDGRP